MLVAADGLHQMVDSGLMGWTSADGRCLMGWQCIWDFGNHNRQLAMITLPIIGFARKSCIVPKTPKPQHMSLFLAKNEGLIKIIQKLRNLGFETVFMMIADYKQ